MIIFFSPFPKIKTKTNKNFKFKGLASLTDIWHMQRLAMLAVICLFKGWKTFTFLIPYNRYAGNNQ